MEAQVGALHGVVRPDSVPAGRRDVVAKLRSRIATPTDAIQIALGLIWLVDGLLQLQPTMFTKSFANQVILPAAQGQPGIVAWPMHQAVHVMLWAPGPMNAFAAGAQLAIGIGFLSRRSVRVAIVASVLWSLNVWFIGEGLGGLAGGSTMLLSGAPGAVLIYAVLALAVWPGQDRPARWLRSAWMFLWLGGAVLQLLPGQASNDAVRAVVSTNAASAPSWLSSVDHWVLAGLPRGGVGVVVFLVALECTVALAALAPRPFLYWGLGVGILLALAFWFVGESLGTYWTGLATDPNSGPLIILLAIAVMATPPAPALAESEAKRTPGLGKALAARETAPA